MKPGYQQFVQLTSSAAGAATEAVGLDEPLSIIAAAIVSTQTYNLLDICGAPDPGDPGLTLEDFILASDLTSPVFADPHIKRIGQWFVHMMWPNWCDCTNGTSPPPSTTGPLPTGGQNPGMPTGSTNGPCWDKTATWQVAAATPGSPPFDCTLQLMPQTQTVSVVPGGSNYPRTAQVVPAGTTLWSLAATLHDSGGSLGMTLVLEFFDSGGNFLNQDFAAFPAGGGNTSVSDTLPTGTHSWHALIGPDTATHNYTTEFSFACPGNPSGQLDTPCCPPDPLLEARLNQIYQLEQAIWNLLVVPSGYTKSTVHSELTGEGTLNVSGVFGFLIDITSGVPTTPQLPGTPPYEFSVGWMSIMTGDGMINEVRISRTHQLWSPPLAGLATIFGYYLNPGFTITMTELVPG